MDGHWVRHGTCIRDVKTFVQAFIDHRLEREQQIRECLNQGYTDIRKMVPVMYTETDESLYGAAARSVLAAMIRMIDTGQVKCDTTTPSVDSSYTLA